VVVQEELRRLLDEVLLGRVRLWGGVVAVAVAVVAMEAVAVGVGVVLTVENRTQMIEGV